MNDFFDKKVFVLGDGISGSGAKYALKQCGAAICQMLAPNLHYIIVSPGVPSEHEIFDYAQKNKIKIIGEIEVGYRLCTKPIIAVTGTNGKTTVTSLIGKILEHGGYKPLVCGNIGISFSQAVVSEDYDIVVLEVSSFQLETIEKFHPYISIITNVSPDHLDRHKTLKNYLNIKRKITSNQCETDYLIIPDTLSCQTKSKTITFGDNGDCRVESDKIILSNKEIISINDVKIIGKHNLLNIMAAVTACKLIGVENNLISKSLVDFNLPKHRIEFVAQKNGINFYDDSKGTNISAVLSAVKSMKGSTCLILCGCDKGFEFDELITNLDKKVTHIVVFGEIKDKVISAAKRCNFATKIYTTSNMKESVKIAYGFDVKNVLLSPGTASFDMYNGYQERGLDFVSEVHKL